MKIGIDISPIFYQRGGVGNYTLHLVENLINLDTAHRFYLYSTHLSDEPFHFLNNPDVRFTQGIKLQLKYKIWRDKIDVVHGPNFRLPGSGTKGNMITIHDLALEKYPSFGKKKFGASFSSWKTRQRALSADRIIAVSQSTKEDIVQIFGIRKEKIRVVYNGVDSFFYSDRDQELFFKIKKKFAIHKDRFILFTGSIEPRKNIKTLLKAFSENRLLRKEFNLILAGGKGWKNEEVQQIILNEGIQDEILMTGYVSKEELRVLYSYASCFVFPSVYEGFGIPPLEAMACGTPVICSNSSSLPEVVGDAAITVDPYDIEGFSSAMEKVVGDEILQKKIINAGFERIKKFSWEKTARETLQVYEELYLT